MPNRQEMIVAIEKQIAEKRDDDGTSIVEDVVVLGGVHKHTTQDREPSRGYLPIMIGDVLDWREKYRDKKPLVYMGIRNDDYKEEILDIVSKWKLTRLPLEYQNDDCVRFIFDLL